MSNSLLLSFSLVAVSALVTVAVFNIFMLIKLNNQEQDVRMIAFEELAKGFINKLRQEAGELKND